MTKARDLANLISAGSILADGSIAASEVTGLATVATTGAEFPQNIQWPTPPQ